MGKIFYNIAVTFMLFHGLAQLFSTFEEMFKPIDTEPIEQDNVFDITKLKQI